MQKRGLWRHIQFIVLTVVVVSGGAGTAYAATTSSSNNYQVTETQFGAGSTQENCSNEYCARASIGDISGGTAASASLSAEFGPITSNEPVLEVIVEPGESNLGILTTEQTATKTSVIRVRNYLSNGYVLQIIGDPPTYKDHRLSTPSAPTASQKGTEQFAVNAVANTVPSVGAGPQQVPSAQTSFGAVENGYDMANMFKYASEDVIARSNSQSGRTDYTISMIINISNSTPAGHFTSDFSAVVIPVY